MDGVRFHSNIYKEEHISIAVLNYLAHVVSKSDVAEDVCSVIYDPVKDTPEKSSDSEKLTAVSY